jgi:hypothetical protein
LAAPLPIPLSSNFPHRLNRMRKGTFLDFTGEMWYNIVSQPENTFSVWSCNPQNHLDLKRTGKRVGQWVSPPIAGTGPIFIPSNASTQPMNPPGRLPRKS